MKLFKIGFILELRGRSVSIVRMNRCSERLDILTTKMDEENTQKYTKLYTHGQFTRWAIRNIDR